MNNSQWRPEEYSMRLACPACDGDRLERITAAGIHDHPDATNQSPGILFRCLGCDHRCWVYLRWAGQTVVLIANTP